MTLFSRTDKSILGRWWWAVDRWIIASVTILAVIGIFLILAASPPVAQRYELDMFHFFSRQLLFMPAALIVMLGISLLDIIMIKRISIVIFCLSFLLMALALFGGVEIKGASRWISFAGFSLQPSEFVKPVFAVISAWLLAAWRLHRDSQGHLVCIGLYVGVILLLIAQPDIGMTILVSLVWGIQFFIAGLPIILVMVIATIFIFGGFFAYLQFSHVRDRINRFLDPQNGEGFQVERSLEAFRNGGVFGTGPGEGKVKELIPDAHSDFIFAVAAEEFGLIVGLCIILLFGFILLRGFLSAYRETDFFVQLATIGLLSQFALQAIINMASTVNLMPTKGMTLPFISYGGSSIMALSLGMGMILALTRQRSSSYHASIGSHRNQLL